MVKEKRMLFCAVIMARKDFSMGEEENSNMGYGHQVFWFLGMASCIAVIIAVIPLSDLNSMTRWQICYVAMSIPFIWFLFLAKARLLRIALIVLDIGLVSIAGIYLFLNSYTQSILNKQQKANLNVGEKYRDSINKVLEEGNELIKIRKYDGAHKFNRDLYPEVKEWRNSISKKLPWAYAKYFLTEEATNAFYSKHVRTKTFDPAAERDKRGNLFNTTFESLIFIRDHPLCFTEDI